MWRPPDDLLQLLKTIFAGLLILAAVGLGHIICVLVIVIG